MWILESSQIFLEKSQVFSKLIFYAFRLFVCFLLVCLFEQEFGLFISSVRSIVQMLPDVDFEK